MNAALTNIYQRRSVRKFKNIPIGMDTIEQILDAGRMAPSAISTQPWRFYVLTDSELIQTLAEEIGLAAEAHFYLAHGVHLSQAADKVFHGAPLVIFVSAPKDYEWAQLDIGMCVQNMMLAAKSLGLDSCPVGFGKFVEKVKSYSVLSAPSNEQIVIAVIFGYGDETPEIRERKRDNAIYLPEIDEVCSEGGAGQDKRTTKEKAYPFWSLPISDLFQNVKSSPAGTWTAWANLKRFIALKNAPVRTTSSDPGSAYPFAWS